MLKRLKRLLIQLRAWMSENERAHREAKARPCCSAPAGIYTARAEQEHSRHE